MKHVPLSKWAITLFVVVVSCTVAVAAPVQKSDPGVDVCFVIKPVVNLRQEPSLESTIVRKLKQGEMLVLLDRIATGEWYNVIHVESGVEGWIHDSTIEIRYTNRPAGPSPFEAQRENSYSDPTVVVTNDTDLDLNLSVGSRKYTIPSNSSRTFTFPAGTFRYVGSAPGVLPLVGTNEWEVGYRYTWRFFIRTVRR